MKRHKASKQVRKPSAARKVHRSPSVRGKAAKPVGRRHGARPARTPASRPEVGSSYSEAIRGIQDAAASLADADLIDIISELSWQSRAKWLSSYFADQLPEEIVTDGDGLAEAVDEIGAQLAALLNAMDAAQPTDFLHAVTCCFSAEPAHIDAGSSWLESHTGNCMIDLAALEGLPGYRAVAESLERVGKAATT